MLFQKTTFLFPYFPYSFQNAISLPAVLIYRATTQTYLAYICISQHYLNTLNTTTFISPYLSLFIFIP